MKNYVEEAVFIAIGAIVAIVALIFLSTLPL